MEQWNRLERSRVKIKPTRIFLFLYWFRGLCQFFQKDSIPSVLNFSYLFPNFQEAILIRTHCTFHLTRALHISPYNHMTNIVFSPATTASTTYTGGVVLCNVYCVYSFICSTGCSQQRFSCCSLTNQDLNSILLSTKQINSFY